MVTDTPAPALDETFAVRRWRGRDVKVFAAMDTVADICERMRGIVGTDRLMNKTASYVGDDMKDLSRLEHATGLRLGGHAAYADGIHEWSSEDQAGISFYLTPGMLNGFGFGILDHRAATEDQVKARCWNADEHDGFNRREDIVLVEMRGVPGQPHRDDRIEIQYWNDNGVLRHTIITFTEPDWCDFGRVKETNYLIMGMLTTDTREPGDDDNYRVFEQVESKDDLPARVQHWARTEGVKFAYAVEETVVRERNSIT